MQCFFVSRDYLLAATQNVDFLQGYNIRKCSVFSCQKTNSWRSCRLLNEMWLPLWKRGFPPRVMSLAIEKCWQSTNADCFLLDLLAWGTFHPRSRGYLALLVPWGALTGNAFAHLRKPSHEIHRMELQKNPFPKKPHVACSLWKIQGEWTQL